ncbi:glutathione S-transferase [Shewanella sairae]|nr:glutathione S-transferase [Shewanella sairae]MCL1130756.1 glutathione S-transferase [Shewanella sairae]
MPLPTLYSFRRCPYAMRARLGILLSKQQVSLREIVLKHKPEAMLAASPKGTVPVLILPDASVIEESIEIMCWALMQYDPLNLLLSEAPQQEIAQALIHTNDHSFKPWLDKYKYADRHPGHSEQYYRQQAEVFIAQLESILTKHSQLMGDKVSIADYAIFPFIRQFASVDKAWFDASHYTHLKKWLKFHIESDAFTQIMKKYPTWLESGESFEFGANIAV